MTREEAQSCDQDVWCLALIDEIYDDFESMVCENCVHWHNEKYTFLMCSGDNPKFGCIDFRRKGDVT